MKNISYFLSESLLEPSSEFSKSISEPSSEFSKSLSEPSSEFSSISNKNINNSLSLISNFSSNFNETTQINIILLFHLFEMNAK
ncbi:hypothetical protein H8356DRAFT_1333253 [Neocallimastix lanati (nom. inval.)]|nr:hypothetical protein H8356DRAFT_1333253 [Neocallimastix sp. JGI-2020a]